MAFDRLRSSYDAVAERDEATFVDELDAKPADRERLSPVRRHPGGARGGGRCRPVRGLVVVAADRRDPYPTEHPTVRLTLDLRG